MLSCGCNHLTSFGGNLIVAPNPINFDEVMAGFANIGDNVAVLVVIVLLLLFYILVVVWARRADKREKQQQVKRCMMIVS